MLSWQMWALQPGRPGGGYEGGGMNASLFELAAGALALAAAALLLLALALRRSFTKLLRLGSTPFGKRLSHKASCLCK